ncbi:hypothetical protein PAL_GLEAN10025059 [Pteropus alecto]|uniref:Uncharacterized protein n=1 Tax=Pteropus alecto TaxID=9402 RepID=L5KLZ0_PTEAL|nr:hypothetical protein PAL_GLEAN10025059 [Pteropus alecto]
MAIVTITRANLDQLIWANVHLWPGFEIFSLFSFFLVESSNQQISDRGFAERKAVLLRCEAASQYYIVCENATFPQRELSAPTWTMWINLQC